jgi:hypothetical protein
VKSGGLRPEADLRFFRRVHIALWVASLLCGLASFAAMDLADVETSSIAAIEHPVASLTRPATASCEAKNASDETTSIVKQQIK